MAETFLDTLKAKSTAAQAEADAAQAETDQLIAAMAIRRAESQAKADAARLAADEVAVEEHRRLTDAERVKADQLTAEADLLSSQSTALSKQAAGLATQAIIARAKANDANGYVAKLVADTKPAGNYVRLEGGGFAEVTAPFGPRDTQVKGVNGQTYDHVGDHPSGAWVYRSRTPAVS